MIIDFLSIFNIDRTDWVAHLIGEMDQPTISDIQKFVSRARSVGIFKKTHATNVLQALKTALEQAKAQGEDPESWTLDEFRERVPGIFQAYGGANNVSPKTVATYESRLLKLLRQFEKHHGDDDKAFHQWKIEMESKREARKARPKKAAPKAASDPQPGSSAATATAALEEPEGVHTVTLPLRDGRRVSLTSPLSMTAKEAKIVLQWIDATLTAAADLAALDEDEEVE